MQNASLNDVAKNIRRPLGADFIFSTRFLALHLYKPSNYRRFFITDRAVLENRTQTITNDQEGKVRIQKLVEIILIAAFSAVTFLSAAQAEPDRLEVPLTYVANRPATYISVNGSEPLLFLIDTGFSSGLALAPEQVALLNLKQTDTKTIDNMGMGSVEQLIYEPVTISIAGADFQIPDVHSSAMMAQLATALGVDEPIGVLSSWTLKPGLVTFDMSQRQLLLEPESAIAPTDPDAIAIIDGSDLLLPEFEVKIDGEPYLAHLDTGSPFNILLPDRFMEKFNYISKPEPLESMARTMGRPHKLWDATIDGILSFGSIRIENPEVTFMESIPGVNIGSGLLNRGVLTLDVANHLMTISIPKDE